MSGDAGEEGVEVVGGVLPAEGSIYIASRDGYEDNILPNGLHAGSPQEALDCACGRYLNDPAARLRPPTNYGEDH